MVLPAGCNTSRAHRVSEPTAGRTNGIELLR